MTVADVATKMLDIYISNVLIAAGWVTAFMIGLKIVERSLEKKAK